MRVALSKTKCCSDCVTGLHWKMLSGCASTLRLSGTHKHLPHLPRMHAHHLKDDSNFNSRQQRFCVLTSLLLPEISLN